MGGENLGVAQNTYAVSWFHGRELNMVFGLQLSFSRVVCCICFVFRIHSADEFLLINSLIYTIQSQYVIIHSTFVLCMP